MFGDLLVIFQRVPCHRVSVARGPLLKIDWDMNYSVGRRQTCDVLSVDDIVSRVVDELLRVHFCLFFFSVWM